MNTRIFVLGAAAGAAIAAIAFVAFRSEPTLSVDDNPDAAMNGETLTPSAKTSPAQPADGAEELPPPHSSEPDGPLQQSDARDPSRILTPEQVETRWHAEARDESWAATSEMALGDYLARQPHPNALGSPSVECRATLCRVVTSVDASVFQASPNADLQAALGNMQHDSLGRELVSVVEGISINDERPGQITMSAYLQRVEPPAASNQ